MNGSACSVNSDDRYDIDRKTKMSLKIKCYWKQHVTKNKRHLKQNVEM